MGRHKNYLKIDLAVVGLGFQVAGHVTIWFKGEDHLEHKYTA